MIKDKNFSIISCSPENLIKKNGLNISTKPIAGTLRKTSKINKKKALTFFKNNIKEIKKVCINYRLRFLDVKYFKGDIPVEAIKKIDRLKKDHSTELKGFKIMAPSKLFKLKNTDDPLLFIPIGKDYYYMIHKWGDDLHPLRKILMWPSKNMFNIIITTLVFSLVLTILTPKSLFSKTNDISTFFIIFLFNFKALAAIVIFCAFFLGKNFNKYIWNSKYNKSV